MVFTLEHWLSAFKGQEPLLILNMFYPDKMALGYADGLFLFALPYAAFRVIGFDYFTSYQLLFICMTVLGYAAWLVLLRRALRLDIGFAVLGAVLLTCLNALQQQAQIGKLTAFNLYPVLIGLLVIYSSTAEQEGLEGLGQPGSLRIAAGPALLYELLPGVVLCVHAADVCPGDARGFRSSGRALPRR